MIKQPGSCSHLLILCLIVNCSPIRLVSISLCNHTMWQYGYNSLCRHLLWNDFKWVFMVSNYSRLLPIHLADIFISKRLIGGPSIWGKLICMGAFVTWELSIAICGFVKRLPTKHLELQFGVRRRDHNHYAFFLKSRLAQSYSKKYNKFVNCSDRLQLLGLFWPFSSCSGSVWLQVGTSCRLKLYCLLADLVSGKDSPWSCPYISRLWALSVVLGALSKVLRLAILCKLQQYINRLH